MQQGLKASVYLPLRQRLKPTAHSSMAVRHIVAIIATQCLCQAILLLYLPAPKRLSTREQAPRYVTI